MNLSAPFLCQVPPFKKSMTDVAPYWDILICNESEAEAFAVSEGWEVNILLTINSHFCFNSISNLFF